MSKKEFDDDLPAIFEAMDQPSIDGVNTWFVSKAAKEAGLKVALSGLGGDELLAGYPSFRRCAALAPPVRSAGRRAGARTNGAPACIDVRPAVCRAPIRRRSACSNMPRAGRAPICCAAGCFCRTSSRRSWMPTSRAKACAACSRSSVCRPVLCPIRAAMSRASRARVDAIHA